MNKVLTIFKTITVPVMVAKKTKDCFTDTKRYSHNKTNRYNGVLEDQPAQPESTFLVGQVDRLSTFKKIVESFLGVKGEISLLARDLEIRGCATTLPTIEYLIETQEAGDDVGIQTTRANFFLVGYASIVYTTWRGGRWLVNESRLDYDHGIFPGSHFFFRNQER